MTAGHYTVGTCRSCGAEVLWMTMQSGKKNPLDPRRLTVVTDEGVAVSGRSSHFATCTHAERHRKRPESEEDAQKMATEIERELPAEEP